MRTATHRPPTAGPHRRRRYRSSGVAWAALTALLGALAVAACSSQPLTDETGKFTSGAEGLDCQNKLIGRIHGTLEWKKNYLPGDFYHGVLSDDWYLCEQQVIPHSDGLVSLICIWCSEANPQWKLIQESCSGQLYRFVPRLTARTAREEGPPQVKCLGFIDVSATAGTLHASIAAEPSTVAELAAFDAGLLDIEDVDVNALSASFTFTLPENVGGFVVAAEAFEVDVVVDGASQLDLPHGVLQIGRGSSVAVSGPLLQVAGWAWYAGLSELTTNVGPSAVRVELHDTLPLAWVATKDQHGAWITMTGADGQPASWWLDPCALGTRGCEGLTASTTEPAR